MDNVDGRVKAHLVTNVLPQLMELEDASIKADGPSVYVLTIDLMLDVLESLGEGREEILQRFNPKR